VPVEMWDRLLDDATDRIDLLVPAGQFLVERLYFIRTLADKAAAGGDHPHFKYGLMSYTPLMDTPGIEIRYHATTLYNSIFRFDEQMIVNAHVYGVPGAHAPALHLRKLGAGDLFNTYAKSFTDVWALSKPATW
jgi:hypothetical protein